MSARFENKVTTTATRLIFVSFLASGTLSTIATRAQSPNPTVPTGLYSAHSVLLNTEIDRLKSPDGTKTLTVRRVEDDRDPDGVHVSFTVTIGIRQFSTQLLGFNSEVLWSRDSAAFAVTQTEGGGGFGYGAYVFFVTENGLRKIDLSKSIARVFHIPGKCEIPVSPNFGVVDWLDGSDRILVAAEVVPVSVCECMGSFKLYEIILPDVKIQRSYSQSVSKQRFWPLLGTGLRSASDSCTKR